MNTTIMVNTQTRDLLRNIGRKDDTYDQIIINLIKAGANKVEEQVKEEYIKKINAICDNHEKKHVNRRMSLNDLDKLFTSENNV